MKKVLEPLQKRKFGKKGTVQILLILLERSHWEMESSWK
jgi:hypothetical protein